MSLRFQARELKLPMSPRPPGQPVGGWTSVGFQMKIGHLELSVLRSVVEKRTVYIAANPIVVS